MIMGYDIGVWYIVIGWSYCCGMVWLWSLLDLLETQWWGEAMPILVMIVIGK